MSKVTSCCSVPKQPLLCPDWVFSHHSNVHVAKDREWFTSYTPFRSEVDPSNDLISDEQLMQVEGIGTVEIRTRITATLHRTVRLENVLHCPTAICNIIGAPFLADYNVTMGFGRQGCLGEIRDKQGRIQGIFAEGKTLMCLKLSGPPKGARTMPSKFDKIANRKNFYIIRANWSADELFRWRTYKAMMPAASLLPSPQSSIGCMVCYDHVEKPGSLNTYDLPTSKEDDRLKGIVVVETALSDPDEILSESEDEWSGTEDTSITSDSDSVSNSEDDFETDPTSHVADHHFSEVELRVVEMHFGHSGNFLFSYGLRPSNDDDCKEGKQIAAAMVAYEQEKRNERLKSRGRPYTETPKALLVYCKV